MSDHEVVVIERPIELAIIDKPTNLIEVGMKGMQGARGFTYTPVVNQNGILGWTNNGDLPNPDDFDLSSVVDVATPISNQEILSVVLSRS